ncbi:DNA-binding transcriptional regulator, LysR family [Cupriavidus sp. OV038]|jgi:DNA-binding transcriptional LysR family regulator|uniref:LysR family transcriptional regulator n=1 Tax=unclassified Cupriavidus TaxID=2640874 RepID=UPI0008E32E1E|nr:MULTISPECIES: LysR family transcriptional regulator [unclassified Cupriavidus]SFC54779.1 DNA-binding transcriptional regulator, LysR family [Cupriavidus sp. OV038]SFP47619.1 DNA-binding transcriptional regulator, LysR family [Cupriavidus sp. OV096]
MKLETFATLAAVIEEGSFAAAAATMHLTPSAVSMQMKQLEQYVGQPLFDRSGLQVRPTAVAREVAAAMEGGLRYLHALRRRVSVAVEGSVRLGVIESIQPVLLPGTLRYLRDHYPKLRVRPVRGRSAGLLDLVKAGQLDAAVVARPETGRLASLRWHPVGTREMVLIAPPDAGEASAAELLARYDWIRYDRATVTGAMAARYVHGVMPEKRSAMEFDSVIAIVAMVSAGLGVSVVQLMDPTVCDRYPVRRVRLGADAPTLQISLVSRKADEDSRVLQALTEAVERTLLPGVR